MLDFRCILVRKESRFFSSFLQPMPSHPQPSEGKRRWLNRESNTFKLWNEKFMIWNGTSRSWGFETVATQHKSLRKMPSIKGKSLRKMPLYKGGKLPATKLVAVISGDEATIVSRYIFWVLCHAWHRIFEWHGERSRKFSRWMHYQLSCTAQGYGLPQKTNSSASKPSITNVCVTW